MRSDCDEPVLCRCSHCGCLTEAVGRRRKHLTAVWCPYCERVSVLTDVEIRSEAGEARYENGAWYRPRAL